MAPQNKNDTTAGVRSAPPQWAAGSRERKARDGRGGRDSPPVVAAAAPGAAENGGQPLAHPLPLRHAGAVVLAGAFAAVDHEPVGPVPAGGADSVRELVTVVGRTAVPFLQNCL